MTNYDMFSGRSPDDLRYRMESLRQQAYQLQQRQQPFTGEQQEFGRIADSLTARGIDDYRGWNDYIEEKGTQQYSPYDPKATETRESPIYAIDYETASRIPKSVNPEIDYPLSLTFQQLQWNRTGTELQPAKSLEKAQGISRSGWSVLIRPDDPKTGEPFTNTQIQDLLNKEIRPGETLGVNPLQPKGRSFTGLSIEQYENPTKHGFAGVYSPKRIGELLGSKITAGLGPDPGKEIQPPVFLGQNITDFDMIHLNRMLQEAGSTPAVDYNAQVADTLEMAKQAGIPGGQRSLSGIFEHMGWDYPGTPHSSASDVQASTLAYPRLYGMTQGQGQSPPTPEYPSPALQSSEQPPSLPPSLPPEQPPPSGEGVNPFRKQSLPDFKEMVGTQMRERLGEDTRIEFRDIRDDVTRMSVTPKGFGEALVLDIAPGYNTPLGPSVEMVSASQWRGIFGSEAIATSAEDISLRSPVESFTEYTAATFSKEMQDLYQHKSPHTIFMYLSNLGQKIAPKGYEVSGGQLWSGPVHTEKAKAEMAQRVNISLSPDIKRRDPVYNAIYHRIATSKMDVPPEDLDQSPGGLAQREQWAKLHGHVITVEGSGRLRTRKFGLTGPDDELLMPVGSDISKQIKRINLIQDARERATIMEQDPSGQVVKAIPEPISETQRGWKGQAGFRLLGGSMPGERERYAALTIPHMAVMEAPVVPGAALIYNPETFGDYISAGYETEVDPEIPQMSMHQLAEAEWDWGRFRQEEGEDEEITYKRMKEGANAIAPGTTGIIGLVKYPSETGGQITSPIKISSSGRPLYLGKPRLDIPIEFSQATGLGTAGIYEGEDQPTDVVPSSIYRETIQEKFGGEVNYAVGGPGTEGKLSLRVPIDIGTGLAGKGAFKVTFAPTPKPYGTDIRNEVDIGLESGDLIKRRVQGVTGDLKSWNLAFPGHFLAMAPKQREMMLGEFHQVNPEMASEMQEYQRSQAEKRVTVPYRGQEIETYGGVSSERLGEIYAKHMGQDYAWETTATQMYGHLRQLVEDLPVEQQIQRYEYAQLEKQSYYMGLFPESSKDAMQFRAREAAQAIMQEDYGIDIETEEGQKQFKEQVYPGGIEQFLGDMFQFEKVDLTPTPREKRLANVNLSAQELFREEGGFFDNWLSSRASQLQPTGRSTPAAQRLGGEYGIEDVSRLPGTGLKGRVLKGDVQSWIKSEASAYSAERELAAQEVQPDLKEEQMYIGSVTGLATLLTFTSPAVPEHLGQAPKMGYEEIAALHTAAPDLADYLGLGVDAVGGAQATGMYPSHARAWREIGDIAQYTASGKILPYSETGEREFTEVTEELASDINKAIGQGADLQELEKVISEYGTGPLYNPTTNILFPRPGTISDISKYAFEQGMEVQKPVASAARHYMEAVQQHAYGITPKEEGAYALRQVMEMGTEVFRSGGRSVEKTLAGRFIPQQITGRYGGISGTPLGYGSGVMPLGSMETILSQMARAEGIKPGEMVPNPMNEGEEIRWLDLAKRQINEQGYIFAGGSRYPVFQREGGSALIPMVTEKILEQQGIQYPTGTTVRGQNVIPGNIMTTGYTSMLDYYTYLLQQGDVDADLITQFLAAKATPEGLDFFSGEDAFREMGLTGEERFTRELKLEEAAHLQEFNALTTEIEAQMRHKLGQPTGKEAGAPGDPVLQPVEYKEAWDEAMDIRQTVSGMAISYKGSQLIESAATAMGWAPEAISRGKTKQAQFYQTYLDKLTHYVKDIQGGGFRNIENILTTATFDKTKATNEAKMLFIPRSGEKHKEWWRTSYGQHLSEKQLSQRFSQVLGKHLTEAVATDVSAMEGGPSYELASYLMATSAEDVPELAEKMQELATGGMEPKEAIRTALWGPGKTSLPSIPAEDSYYATHDATRSPLGLATYASAYGHLIGWQNRQPKYVDIEGKEGERERLLQLIGTQTATLHGKSMSIAALSEDPVMRRTMILQNWQTGRYGLGNLEGDVTYAPASPEDQLAMESYRQELIEADKPVPFLLDYYLNQERVEKHEASLPFAETKMLKDVTTGQAQKWVAQHLHMGSSTLPFFAMEGNYGIGGNEVQMREEHRRDFIAQNVFDVSPDLLVTPEDRAGREELFASGNIAEAAVTPELAERFNMFKYEERQGEQVPVVGPIYGVEHERTLGERPDEWIQAQKMLRPEMLAEHPEWASLKTSLHLAPDIAGPTYTPTGKPSGYLLGEVKWSETEGGASQKPTSSAYKLQVAQQQFLLEGLARGHPKEIKTAITSLIRQTPWFQKYWGAEALGKAGITDPTEIEAEQNRVLEENWKAHRKAINMAPIESRMFPQFDKPDEPRPVGTFEEQRSGFGLGDLTTPTFIEGIFSGIEAGEELNRPQEIIDMRSKIHSAAFTAGTSSELGAKFRGVEGTAPGARPFTGVIPRSQRVLSTLQPSDQVPVYPTPRTGGAGGGDDETGDGEQQPPDFKTGEEEYIPWVSREDGGMGLSVRTSAGQPWLEELVNRGLASKGGGLPEGETEVRLSHFGYGQDPIKAAERMSYGLTSAQGMMTAPFIGGGENQIWDFEKRIQVGLGSLLGMGQDEALGMAFPEILAKAKQEVGDTEGFRNLLLRERGFIEQGSSTYRALESGWQAGKSLSQTPEEKSIAGAVLGMEQEDAIDIGGQTYMGLSGKYESLGRNLKAATLLKESIGDWKTLQGGAKGYSLKELENFQNAIVRSTEAVDKFADVLEDPKSTDAQVQAAEKGIQRENLLQEREMRVLAQKHYTAQARMFMAEGGAEGADPRDLLAAHRGRIQETRAIARIDEKAAKLLEEEEGLISGKIKPEGGTGRFMRRALGGFGIMYLRTLGGFITGGMGRDQGPRTELDMMLAQAGMAGTGQAGEMPINQQQRVANIQALGGSAINPLLAFQEARSNIPGLNELTTATQAGLGAYAGLMWYGSFSDPETFLGQLGRGQKAQLPKILGGGKIGIGKIVGGITAAAVIGQAISSQADMEGVAFRQSVVKAEGYGFWEQAAKLISLEGVTGAVREIFDEEYYETKHEFRKLRGALYTGKDVQGTAPPATMLSRTARIAVEQMPEYAPEAVTGAVSQLWRSEQPVTLANIEALAKQTQLGGADVTQLASAMLQARGVGAGERMVPGGELALELARTEYAPKEISSIAAGIEFAGKLGPAITSQIPGMETPGGMAQQYRQWGEVVGTAVEPLAIKKLQTWYQEAQLGRVKEIPELPSPDLTPAEIRKGELEEAIEQIPLTMEDTYQATMAQAFGGILTPERIQEWTATGVGGVGFAGLTRGQQIKETGKIAQLEQIRLLREDWGEPFGEFGAEVGISLAPAQISRSVGLLERRRATKGELTSVGYTDEEAREVAEQYMQVQRRGPQGEALSRYIEGFQGQAEMLGLDMSDFVKQLSAGVEEAVIGGMATGIATTAAGLGFDEKEMFAFASQDYQQLTQAQAGVGITQRIAGLTGRMEDARQIGGLAMEEGGLETAQFLQRLYAFEPLALTQAAQAGMVPDWMATTNITLGGAVTTQPLFTSSMMQGQTQMTSAVFGPLADTEAGKAAQFGINALTGQVYGSQQEYDAAAETMRGEGLDPAQFIQGGQRGLSLRQMYRGFEYQQQQAGTQLAQIALQEKYQPQFWAIEDKQRALQHRQSLWGFEMQERQMTMQKSQFFENIGFQQQQAQTQRRWTMEDWGYQDQMRNMQWGWKQEDYAENVRFMSGRERKLAERQMERETIMYGMEGDRIGTQRDRQKEMWAMEDERFEMQKKHFLEHFALQEENLKKQQQFYEEGKRLRDEQIALQRAQWKENIALQKQAASAADAYAKDMEEIQKSMALLGTAQSDYTDRVQVATTNEVKMINTLIDGTNWFIEKAPAALRSILSGLFGGSTTLIPGYKGGGSGGSGKGKGDNKPQMRAIGGPALGLTVVGESGAEILESSIPSGVMPNNELSALLFGQETNFSSYWNNSYIDMKPTQGEGEPTTVNVFLGNERLGKYVLDAVKNDLEVG